VTIGLSKCYKHEHNPRDTAPLTSRLDPRSRSIGRAKQKVPLFTHDLIPGKNTRKQISPSFAGKIVGVWRLILPLLEGNFYFNDENQCSSSIQLLKMVHSLTMVD